MTRFLEYEISAWNEKLVIKSKICSLYIVHLSNNYYTQAQIINICFK